MRLEHELKSSLYIVTVQLQCNSSSKVIESVNILRYGTQPLPPQRKPQKYDELSLPVFR